MKKNIFKTVVVAFILFVGISSQAQITKGNWMVGGSGYFKNIKYKAKNNPTTATESNHLGVTPNIGYFVIDKLALGLKSGLYYYEQDKLYKDIHYSIGPFVKYYFLNTEKRVNVFAQADYSYNESNSKTWNTKSSSKEFNFKIGTAVFFNSSVALETGLEYINTLTEINKGRTFQVSVGLQIHLKK